MTYLGCCPNTLYHQPLNLINVYWLHNRKHLRKGTRKSCRLTQYGHLSFSYCCGTKNTHTKNCLCDDLHNTSSGLSLGVLLGNCSWPWLLNEVPLTIASKLSCNFLITRYLLILFCSHLLSELWASVQVGLSYNLICQVPKLMFYPL